MDTAGRNPLDLLDMWARNFKVPRRLVVLACIHAFGRELSADDRRDYIDDMASETITDDIVDEILKGI